MNKINCLFFFGILFLLVYFSCTDSTNDNLEDSSDSSVSDVSSGSDQTASAASSSYSSKNSVSSTVLPTSSVSSSISSTAALNASAGNPFYAKINTGVTINGTASGHTSAVWTQIGGTTVDSLVSNVLQLTFTINSATPNFEELTFRLTVSDGTSTLTSDIIVTAVIYSKVYRVGTFNVMTPGYQTEFKEDWTVRDGFTDASGGTAYTPGYWFTFNDNEATGHASAPGNSVINPKPLDNESKLFSPGFNNHGKCLKMDYTHATNGYIYTFVGWGIKFANNSDPSFKHPFDITSTTGVAFRIKSDAARNVKISIVSPIYTSWGTYDAGGVSGNPGFTTSTSWVVKTYNWSSFVFPPASWSPGTQFTITQVLQQMAGVQIQTTSTTAGETGTFYIDDLIIYTL